MWQADQDDLCPGCGHPRSETFDPDNEDAYEAQLLTCHACAARDRRNRQLDNPGPGQYVMAKEVGHG